MLSLCIASCLLCASCVQVCGSDGVTYESICELEGVEGERLDYEGETRAGELICADLNGINVRLTQLHIEFCFIR